MMPRPMMAAPTAQTAPDLDRIRKALEAPAAPLSVRAVPREGPIFRLTVEGIDLDAAWKDRSMVPPYVHTWMRAYHHEHMEMVTPEEFRGATLYPVGVPVDMVVGYLVKEIAVASRRFRERRARETVRKELERFVACRPNSTNPDCTRH